MEVVLFILLSVIIYRGGYDFGYKEGLEVGKWETCKKEYLD